MAKLSITTAWNQASEILKRDFGALFTVAVALIAAPSFAMQVLGPSPTAPGTAPEPGLWLLFFPIVIVLSIVGTIAISTLALGRERVVGAAIAHGFRRFLPMFGAGVLMTLAVLILCVPLFLIFGIDLEALLRGDTSAISRMFLAVAIFVVIAIFFAVRLMLTTPVAAAERVGPIGIIKRSWELTSGHFWKLLGFIILLIILLVVIMMVVMMVFGLLIAAIAGPPEPGSFASLLILLLSGLINAAFTAIFTTIVARIYVQLAGDLASTAEVFE